MFSIFSYYLNTVFADLSNMDIIGQPSEVKLGNIEPNQAVQYFKILNWARSVDIAAEFYVKDHPNAVQPDGDVSLRHLIASQRIWCKPSFSATVDSVDSGCYYY